MKLFKLVFTVLITVVCAGGAHAQKQLKCLSEAVTSRPVIRMPLNVRAGVTLPACPPLTAAGQEAQRQAARAMLGTSAAVERQVVAQVGEQKIIARLENNLNKLEEYVRTHNNRLPDLGADGEDIEHQVRMDIGSLRRRGLRDNPLIDRYIRLIGEDEQQMKKIQQGILNQRIQVRFERLEKNLTRLEEYASTHNNKLPPYENYGSSLQGQVGWDIWFLRKHNVEIDLFRQRYNQLIEADRQQYEQEKLAREEQQWQEAKLQRQQEYEDNRRMEQLMHEFRAQEQAAKERAWKQVLLQDKAWKNEMKEETSLDTDAEASKAAALAKRKMKEPKTITKHYIENLLRFYNKLDPMGTGTVQ